MKESSNKGHLIHVEVHQIKLSLGLVPSSIKITFFSFDIQPEKQVGRFGRVPTHGMTWLENPSFFLQPTLGFKIKGPLTVEISGSHAFKAQHFGCSQAGLQCGDREPGVEGDTRGSSCGCSKGSTF